MTSGPVFSLTVDHRPLDSDVLDAVQDLTVETAMDMASAFSIRFGAAPTRTGGWTAPADGTFSPLTSVGIRVGAGGGRPEAVLNGVVTAQRSSWSEGGRTYVEVSGTDATGLMNLEERVKAWPNMPDSAIASAIFGQHSLIPQVTTTDTRLVEPEGTTMQRGTDIRFLRRLARRNGFDCYVQPEPTSGLDTGVFGPPQLKGQPSAVLSVAMGDLTNVAELTARYDMTRPTTAVAAGLDATKNEKQSVTTKVAGRASMANDPTLDRVTSGGRAVVVLPADTGALTTAELQPLADAIVDRSSMAVTIEGRTGPDVGILRPGRLVAVRGAGKEFNGTYLLIQVRLTLGPGRFEQRFVAKRNALAATGSESLSIGGLL